MNLKSFIIVAVTIVAAFLLFAPTTVILVLGSICVAFITLTLVMFVQGESNRSRIDESTYFNRTNDENWDNYWDDYNRQSH